MISFRDFRPAPAPRPEVRTSGYTSAIVNAIESAAGGAGGGVATATAAVECASGLWGRALSLATVAPMNRRTSALTPSVLAMIGRALCRSGEIVFLTDVARGRVQLLPASAAYVVVGHGDPSTWVYTVTVDGPGNTRTVHRGRSGVAHLQYMTDPIRPWFGRAPWSSAGLSGTLLAGIERQLAGEAGSASGYILPTPDLGDRGQGPPDGPDADEEEDPLTTLRRDLAAAGGKTVLAPTTAAGYGAGPGAAPSKDFVPERFGFNPPTTAVETRRDAERSILAACGVPPALASHSAPGTSLREAWRQLTVGTIEPIATIVADQLSEALGVKVSLTLPVAADVKGIAVRSVAALVQSGVPIAEARKVVGI